MPRYKVILSRIREQWAEVHVEAENEEEAHETAIDKAGALDLWETRKQYSDTYRIERLP